MFAVVLTLLAPLCLAETPMEEVAACMATEETTSIMTTQGNSYVIMDNPGLIAPGGAMYGTRAMATTLSEFEGMWKALTECAKEGGDLTYISSGKATWFAPEGEPYTIYTQKARSLSYYGTFKERVDVVGKWVEFATTEPKYVRCPNLSDAAKKELIDLTTRAYELWQDVFDYHPASRALSRPSQAAPSQGAWDHTLDQTYGMKERNGADAYTKEETWSRKEWRKKQEEAASLAMAQAEASNVDVFVQGFAVFGLAFVLYGAYKHYSK